MVEKYKIKAMTTKYCRNKKGISSFNKKKENFENNNRENMDLDQVNNKYLLQF